MMKILIGYDGSREADASLDDLRKAGLPSRAEAILLSTCSPFLPLEALAPNAAMPPGYERAYAEAYANHQVVVKAALARAQAAARKLRGVFPGWKIAAEVITDTAAHAVLDKAEDWKPGLIVLGSRGWSEIGKLILGNVADRVLNHATCPVRIARPRKLVLGPKGGALGKGVLGPKGGALGKGARGTGVNLLIAYDGSKHADAAVAAVADRAWPKGSRVTVLAVSEFQLRIGDLSLALTKALGRSAPASPWPWMEARLAKVAKTLETTGLSVATALLIGEPRQAIVEQAKLLKIDCVFLGSHGYTGLRRVMLGSVSAAVAAHAPCSVEVIHLKRKGKKT